ncbi:DUF4942 domain-containing protein [Rhodosalinus sediminis]|uniref:DUF4942 domain-containing protein n=1 Tax=Rhodosalinus sediminis TaxID=1940533 RepID=UPI0023540272|nr:DUF4942 domain-containing protein [Rhodosalinus sediminis]
MTMHTPVERSEITRICRNRLRALEAMTEAADALEAAYGQAEQAEKIARQADIGCVFHALDRREAAAYKMLLRPVDWDRAKSLDLYRRQLDAGIWQHLLTTTGLRRLMDAEALEALERELMDAVPEATEANVRATIEALMGDAALIFQRGLANAFAKLDPRFKSHDAFKIGARIIFPNAFDDWGGVAFGNRTWRHIADVERVLALLDGAAPGMESIEHAVRLDRRGHGPHQSQTETRYFRLDGFKNGNAHLWFTRDDLVERANKVLAEFYGEVLPDAADPEQEADLFRSREVAKDLAFYPTPPAVAARVTDDLSGDLRVLEPSAGQGALALPLAERGAVVRAIEVNPRHIDVLQGEARRRRVTDRMLIEEANFLRVPAVAAYDAVVMNPPFYGTHWMAHVRHAFEFLKPGGILRAVLPASAEVNDTPQHRAFRAWAKPYHDRGWRGGFEELPPESFAEAGTRVQTVVLHLRNR